VVKKKSVLDIEKEFAKACKDLVKNKKTGVC
jgi:hypothetical protein